MKKIKLIILILSIVFTSNLYSQSISSYTYSNWCGTFASKEDINFIRSLKAASLKSGGSENTKFRVQHHIVRDGNGNNGLSPSVITSIMSALNDAFISANVQFYTCGSVDLIDSDMYYQIDTYSEELSLRNTYNDPDAINIYYFNNLTRGFWAYTYQNGSTNFIAIHNLLAPNGTTVPHEMGHFFGLLHTFEGYSFPPNASMELVTRGTSKNCDTAGDELCDTPADPKIGPNEVNSNCYYIGTARDANNDLYIPDVTNFMSYSRHECRNNFSNEQNSIISNMASSTGKQIFIHRTEIVNNSSLNGNYTDDFISVESSTINNGANVVLDACQEIELKINFEIKLGATFEAKI